MGSPVLPGRLGSPGMSLRDDPRADPRMIAAMEPFGLGEPPAPAPVDSSSPIEDLLEYVALAEEGFEALFGALAAELPPIEGVERTRRGDQGSRRQRCHRLRPSTGRAPRRPAGRAAPARRRHGAARSGRRGLRPLARRAGRHWPRRRRRRVPQRWRQARPAPVPGRARRLLRRAALGDRAQVPARDRHARRVGRVRWGEPDPRHRAARQARRPARAHRRRVRHVPLHLQRLGRAACPSCRRSSRTTGTSSRSP